MFLLYNFIHSYKDTNEAYPIFIYHIHWKNFFVLFISLSSLLQNNDNGGNRTRCEKWELFTVSD